MATLDAVGFAIVVWGTVGLVLGVSLYLGFSIARDAGWAFTR